jgi:hypothetical protein
MSLIKVIQVLSNQKSGSTPKDKVLFRIRGQSNANGAEEKANFPSEFQSALTYAKIWWPYASEWQDFHIGVNNAPDRGELTQTDFGGCEPMLAKLIQTNKNKTTYFSKFAIGGSQLALDGGIDDWNTGSTNEYFDQSITRFNNSIANLNNYTFIDLWIHGHEDAKVTAKADAYEANLTSLINESSPNLWVMTRLSENNNSDPTNRATINQAMIDVAATNFRYFVTSTNYETRVGDLPHYTYDGYNDMATDIYNAIKNYI